MSDLYTFTRTEIELVFAHMKQHEVHCGVCIAKNDFILTDDNVNRVYPTLADVPRAAINLKIACNKCGNLLSRDILEAISKSLTKQMWAWVEPDGIDWADPRLKDDRHDALVYTMSCFNRLTGKEAPEDPDSTPEKALAKKASKYMAGVIEDFLPALKEIAELGSMNNKPFGKYERSSWMNLKKIEYKDAFWRHILEGPDNIDPESGKPHDVAIAWNAIALVWFRLKEEGKI